MSGKEVSREKRNTFLYLRKKIGFKAPPKELQERLKEQNEIKKKILEALKTGPKTVPEIAKETGIDTYTVFWYLMTYLRYKHIEPVEKTDEGYWKYKWVETG